MLACLLQATVLKIVRTHVPGMLPLSLQAPYNESMSRPGFESCLLQSQIQYSSD